MINLGEWKNLPKVINRESLVEYLEEGLNEAYAYHKPTQLKDEYVRTLNKIEEYTNEINSLPEEEVQDYFIFNLEREKQNLRETFEKIEKAELVIDTYHNVLHKVKYFKL